MFKGINYAKMKNSNTIGLLLISPWLIGFLLFKLFPIVASLGLSFTDFYMLEPQNTQFVGLENYRRALDNMPVGFFIIITINVILETVPLQLGASLLFATMLNSARLKLSTFTRTLFFIPSIIPGVAVLFMFFGFVNPDSGWLNKLFLEPFGFDGQNSAVGEAATDLIFLVSSLWSIGPGILIMLGAMQAVPEEVMEAARVDGAGPIVRFFGITLPIISPAIFFALIINLISVFGGVILLDRNASFRGGNSPFTRVITNIMFDDWELGFASSVAWIFFVVVMVIVWILFRTSRSWVFYPDQEGV